MHVQGKSITGGVTGCRGPHPRLRCTLHVQSIPSSPPTGWQHPQKQRPPHGGAPPNKGHPAALGTQPTHSATWPSLSGKPQLSWRQLTSDKLPKAFTSGKLACTQTPLPTQRHTDQAYNNPCCTTHVHTPQHTRTHTTSAGPWQPNQQRPTVPTTTPPYCYYNLHLSEHNLRTLSGSFRNWKPHTTVRRPVCFLNLTTIMWQELHRGCNLTRPAGRYVLGLSVPCLATPAHYNLWTAVIGCGVPKHPGTWGDRTTEVLGACHAKERSE